MIVEVKGLVCTDESKAAGHAQMHQGNSDRRVEK
jgi:hypothetical protein